VPSKATGLYRGMGTPRSSLRYNPSAPQGMPCDDRPAGEALPRANVAAPQAPDPLRRAAICNIRGFKHKKALTV